MKANRFVALFRAGAGPVAGGLGVLLGMAWILGVITAAAAGEVMVYSGAALLALVGGFLAAADYEGHTAVWLLGWPFRVGLCLAMAGTALQLARYLS